MIRKSLASWASEVQQPLELLVLGGGATGLGVAVQAALEGRYVALVEARDFASGTSSRSTKLLHGGVRYLAQGHVKLVKEALKERSIVMRLAPHLAQPLPFVVAEKRWYSWIFMVLGLKMYTWLAGRLSLGATHALSAIETMRALPSLKGVVAGIRYWDGQFEDARLAMALAKTAHQAGAHVRNHARVVGIQKNTSGWSVELEDALSGERCQLQTKTVVNATGVWVDCIRKMLKPLGDVSTPAVRPSQGVHIVVSRQTLPINEAILVPRTSDGRVLFAVPWLGATVIGTTDTPRPDMPEEPSAFASELEFLFQESHKGLGVRIQPSEVLSVWVGLRPLVTSKGNTSRTAEISREHWINRESEGFVTVTGGKWTTYRAMAAEVIEFMVSHNDLSKAKNMAQTSLHPLNGTCVSTSEHTSLRDAPGVHLLGVAQQDLDAIPGKEVSLGLGLTEAMVRYSARNEWAVTVEDMLARRWRTLFLDAKRAQSIAPRVAEILFEETGIDPQLSKFLDLCAHYQINKLNSSQQDITKETRL